MTSFLFLFQCLQVNTNGLLSFGTPMTSSPTEPFPLAGPSLVAPFWSDVDTSGTGEIFFREDSTISDFTLIENVTAEVTRAFVEDFGSFTPTTVFVATWNQVGYYNGNTDLVSYPFQCSSPPTLNVCQLRFNLVTRLCKVLKMALQSTSEL